MKTLPPAQEGGVRFPCRLNKTRCRQWLATAALILRNCVGRDLRRESGPATRSRFRVISRVWPNKDFFLFATLRRVFSVPSHLETCSVLTLFPLDLLFRCLVKFLISALFCNQIFILYNNEKINCELGVGYC